METTVTQSQLPKVLSSRMSRFAVLAAIALLVIALAPAVVYPVFLMEIMCFAIFASAFNLLFGYSGLLSFGHAAFFGSAAYIFGYVQKNWAVGPEVAIVCGVAVALAVGLVFGLLAIRRQGIYFSMITLALAQMFYFICYQAPFTGGDDGMQSIPRGKLVGLIDLQNIYVLYAFVAVMFILSTFTMWRVIHSPFGFIVRAIRDDENRAISLGYRIQRYKLAMFVLSAGFAGVAGTLHALLYQFASITSVSWLMSGEAILITLIGGIGSTLGPLAGSVVIVWLESYMATTSIPVPIAFGVIFIFCVLVLRRGIVGELAQRQLFGRKPRKGN